MNFSCVSTEVLFMLIVCLLSAEFSCSRSASHGSCSLVDVKALLQFKDSLVDPEKRLSSWHGRDCCQWRGISCGNKTGSIIGIDLHNPYPQSLISANSRNHGFWNLSGIIDSSLLLMNSLRYLDLSFNSFHGIPIPTFLGSFKRLQYLNLSNAGFVGLVPASLGNLSSLKYLDLSSDYPALTVDNFDWFSGLSSLVHLELDGVDLSMIGPEWIQTSNRLPFLRELHLEACGLSDLISSLRFVNLTSLVVVDLAFNSFNAKFPNWLLNISSLVYIDISSASLHGSIPHELSSLPKLKYLDLSLNNLTANCSLLLGGRWGSLETFSLGSNKLYGHLPASLGNISSLVDLDLFANDIEGGIPSSISKLCRLRMLRLAGNNLNLELPRALHETNDACGQGQFLPSLTYLDLGSNKIKGVLPEWLGGLSNLTVLDLDSNLIRGSIPLSLGNLSLLTELSIGYNDLSGAVPSSIGELSKLVVFDISSNRLTGTITESLFSKLSNLKILTISSNSLVVDIIPDWHPPFQVRNLGMRSCKFVSQFPYWLRNQRELQFLDLSNTSISGIPPSWFWELSMNLSYVNISFNRIQGHVPNRLTVAAFADVDMRSNLLSGPVPLISNTVELLDLSHNQLSGPIPSNIGEVQPYLIYFSLSSNNLSGEIPGSIALMQGLQVLDLSRNSLIGTIPSSLGNYSYLKALVLEHNNLYSAIPGSLGSLRQLQSLRLSDNRLSGGIPPTLGNCSNLETIDLGRNRLVGEIPSWVGRNFPVLRILRLSLNSFSGQIPSQLSNLSSLQILNLGSNVLEGPIPSGVGDLKSMDHDNKLQKNLFYGWYRGNYYEESLSMHVNNKQLVYTTTLSLLTSIDLSQNKLSGELPKAFARLSGLLLLNLSSNDLNGKIPSGISNMSDLMYLDISNNRFSGQIPSSMPSLTFLSFLNLSNNNFSGSIPTSGQFETFGASSYFGNQKLCGRPLAVECRGTNENGMRGTHNQEKRKGQQHLRIKIVTLIAVVIMCLLIAAVSIFVCKKATARGMTTEPPFSKDQFPRISYSELAKATDDFSSTNQIGRGRYSSVYKGTLFGGNLVVAVKVLDLDVRGSSKTFINECRTLRSIRHRNLLKILTSCSSIDRKGNEFKALVFEFMPNGSLDNWLHPNVETDQQSHDLLFIQRLNLAIDIAEALEYLHHNCRPPLVHCDLKPSNVLLDHDMSAHVADFGLAKILFTVTTSRPLDFEDTSSTTAIGTIGYVAPEYGAGGRATAAGDVYSYGMILLEMVTGKRPVDDMFKEGLTLRSYVEMNASPEQVMEIADRTMFSSEEEIICRRNLSNYEVEITSKCLLSIVEVGLLCSNGAPNQRISMTTAVTKMHATREIYYSNRDQARCN